MVIPVYRLNDFLRLESVSYTHLPNEIVPNEKSRITSNFCDSLTAVLKTLNILVLYRFGQSFMFQLAACMNLSLIHIYDSRPRFPYRIVRGGERPQGIIREDYTRAKRENDGIRVGCFGRQAQQPLESMMIYQHINIPTRCV